ncbi:MAG: GNAT family N-acetyltransferase [Acidiferrobacterales bacterium]|nr:GNAT family N-acetyltransferase [Acidiferrobacterales bacterium]
MINLTWQWQRFEELTVVELHDLLRLRQAVFVVEQNCVYADIDELDKTAWHLLARHENSLCAYARVIPPNQNQVSIGRVLTSSKLRGQGVGKQVMQQSLDFIALNYPNNAIKISAQAHLERFYSEFGFVKTSDPYDEDGILHVDMLAIGYPN